MIKKILGGVSLGLFALSFMLLGGSAHAAADPALTNAIASSTGFFTDNATVIVGFVVDIVLKLAGIALAIGAIYFVYRKVKTIFSR